MESFSKTFRIFNADKIAKKIFISFQNGMEKINFKGSFISTVNISKIRPLSAPVKVSAVELNPLDNRDLKVLQKVHSLWSANFSGVIYKDAEKINLTEIPDDTQKFFVLTRQKNNFENLCAEDVLAEIKVIPEGSKSIFLDYLQVQPDNMFDSDNRIFKGIGTAALNFLKKLYNGKEINLHSLYSSRYFYEQNGFRPVEPESNNLYFIA